METIPEPSPERKNKQALVEFFKEAIGLEHGLTRTVVDLWKTPDKVVVSYLDGASPYVSPYKILFAGVGLWLFINNLFIDWYAIWAMAVEDMFDFLVKHVFDQRKMNMEVFTNLRSKMVVLYSRVCGDLFSKLYVLLIVASSLRRPPSPDKLFSRIPLL